MFAVQVNLLTLPQRTSNFKTIDLFPLKGVECAVHQLQRG